MLQNKKGEQTKPPVTHMYQTNDFYLLITLQTTTPLIGTHTHSTHIAPLRSPCFQGELKKDRLEELGEVSSEGETRLRMEGGHVKREGGVRIQ